MSFHDEIKARSDAAHAQAESAPFIAELMSGALDEGAYKDYLSALLPIYQQMEQLIQSRSEQPLISYFNHRALNRSEKLINDIAVLSGDEKNLSSIQPLESTLEYVARLTGDISDARLLAHHYIRYLGDLSGGQAISRLVSRHYGIDDEALTFYDFNEIGDVVFYKKRYRDLLNLIPLTPEEKQVFLDEVTHLYRLSTEIFLDLGKTHLAKTA